MVAVRLQAIRQQVGIHIVATENDRMISDRWEPHTILFTVPNLIDLTGIMYLHKDITSTICAQMPTTTERIETLPRDHSQLRNTPSFALDFVALVASIPICYIALCHYSSRKPCTYSDALHSRARQAEILWYNNNPEDPPSFSHCYLAINEITSLSNNFLRKAGDTLTDIDTVHTRHAQAMSKPGSPRTLLAPQLYI